MVIALQPDIFAAVHSAETSYGGKLQPNYSQWGGSLISASLANTYCPESSRGAGLVFTNFGTSMGLHVVLGLAHEFILG